MAHVFILKIKVCVIYLLVLLCISHTFFFRCKDHKNEDKHTLPIAGVPNVDVHRNSVVIGRHLQQVMLAMLVVLVSGPHVSSQGLWRNDPHSKA